MWTQKQKEYVFKKGWQKRMEKFYISVSFKHPPTPSTSTNTHKLFRTFNSNPTSKWDIYFIISYLWLSSPEVANCSEHLFSNLNKLFRWSCGFYFKTIALFFSNEAAQIVGIVKVEVASHWSPVLIQNHHFLTLKSTSAKDVHAAHSIRHYGTICQPL